MAQQEVIVDIVSKLLNDKNNVEIKDDIPTVVCSLLRPFVKKTKISKSTEVMVGKMIRSYGICSRCRSSRIKHPEDLFCKSCKSVLKDQARKLIG